MLELGLNDEPIYLTDEQYEWFLKVIDEPEEPNPKILKMLEEINMPVKPKRRKIKKPVKR